ncbi:ABC transporter permease [Halosimplex litoreum]|uniref:ABC transporter permease n=1 Tax=Halosimplex litoreum TaxID=1198301 RepID=A0A7T3KV85_9EURY|nr:ABC transporter permease subunit [Halosimplex litoreum]QPV62743.1 ABC transporter permease [Halosimplex litoreum]
MSGPPPVGGDDRSGGESGTASGASAAQRFARWLRTRVENVARIARWEVTKNAGGVDRRTVAIALLAVLGLGAMAPVAVSQGVALDQGIYRVGVVEEDPLYGPASLDQTFRVQDPSQAAVEAGDQEVVVVGPRVRSTDSTKGRAAVAELRSTTKRYNDGIMDDERNQSAAFPVVVNLTYVERESSRVAVSQTRTLPVQTDDGEAGDGDGTAGDGGGGGSGEGAGSGTGGDGGVGDGSSGGSSDGAGSGSESTGSGGETSTGAGSDGGAGDGSSDGSGDGASGGDESADVTTPSEGSGVAGSSIGARLTGGSSTGAPSDIAPPFPFQSLVLAFVFVLPLNFVIQAYGSTILSERINRRGELLLVAPVSRGDIVVGKTLPYFAAAVGVATAITLVLQVGLGLGGSAISVLAVVPLALLFLAATFLGAMFARSFKELTFVTVTITVSLTSYAFVPAIFTDVTPIALISPLTLVVRDLQGQAVGLGQFVFSTLPPTLTALVCFGLGAGLYREEDMFTQRPIPYKVLDALAGPIERRRSVALVTAVLLPFVLVAELVVAAFAYPLWQAELPVEVIVVAVLVGLAIVEELAKSLHVYAGYAHSLFDGRLRTALVVGAFSGLGFFLAEKLTLIVRLADLQTLPVGQTLEGSQAAVGTGVPLGILFVALLLAPLALHVVTATISTLGARRGRRSYAVALVVAVAVHVAYNLTVVTALVG